MRTRLDSGRLAGKVCALTLAIVVMVVAPGLWFPGGHTILGRESGLAQARTGGPARVAVGAYYGKYFGGVAADAAWMARHADFAEGEAKTIREFKRAGGRYGMFYTDPNKVVVTRHEPYSDLPESAWLHDPQGNRVSALRHSGDIVNFLNPEAPETQSAFASTTLKAKATGVYDYVFLDDASADVVGHIYPAKATPAELRSDEDLIAGLKQLIAQSALPVIVNGLSNSDERLGQASLNVQLLSVAAGGLAEGCFANAARLKRGPSWMTDAESLLAATAQGKWAMCMVGAPRGDENEARLFGYASWLLTYDAAHSVIWENLHTPSRVEIFPEQAFVATDPLKTAKHIWDLKQPDGGYERDFNNCFYQGASVGACATVVNTGQTTVSIPSGYSKQVVLVGDGSWDGGTLVLQSNVPSELPSGSAAILVR